MIIVKKKKNFLEMKKLPINEKPLYFQKYHFWFYILNNIDIYLYAFF